MASRLQYMIMGALLTILITLGGLAWLQTDVSAKERKGSESVLVSTNEMVESSSNEEVEKIDREGSVSLPAQPLVATLQDGIIETDRIGWIESTDLETILEHLRQLAKQQVNDLQGKEGWLNITITGPELHESNTEASQDLQGPDGQVVPAQEMYPPGTGIVSRWYYVDEDGLVEQGLTFTSDANDQIYQLTLLQEDEWVNMTLRMHGFDEDTSSTPTISNKINDYLSIQEAIQFLLVASSSENQTEEISVNAYEENGRYHLLIHSAFTMPIELGYPIPEPIIAADRHFVFDGINANLLMDTHNFTLESGDVFQAGIAEYHTSPLLPQLPDDIQQLLENTRQVLEGEAK